MVGIFSRRLPGQVMAVIFWAWYVLLIVAGPVGLAGTLQSTQRLQTVNGDYAIFGILAGLLFILVFAGSAYALLRRPSEGTVLSVVSLILIGISGAAWFILGLTYCVAWLALRHAVEIAPHIDRSNVQVGLVARKLLYDVLDAVPVVEIPKTIGWEDPLPDPAAGFGWVLLVAKAVTVVAVVSFVIRLVAIAPQLRRSKRPLPAEEQPSATAAAVPDETRR